MMLRDLFGLDIGMHTLHYSTQRRATTRPAISSYVRHLVLANHVLLRQYVLTFVVAEGVLIYLRFQLNQPYCRPFGNRRLVHCTNGTADTPDSPSHPSAHHPEPPLPSSSSEHDSSNH